MCNSKTGQNIFLHVPNTMEGTDSFKIIFIKVVFGVKLHDCIQVRHPPLGKKIPNKSLLQNGTFSQFVAHCGKSTVEIPYLRRHIGEEESFVTKFLIKSMIARRSQMSTVKATMLNNKVKVSFDSNQIRRKISEDFKKKENIPYNPNLRI